MKTLYGVTGNRCVREKMDLQDRIESSAPIAGCADVAVIHRSSPDPATAHEAAPAFRSMIQSIGSNIWKVLSRRTLPCLC